MGIGKFVRRGSGKKLARLHAANAWIVLTLAVTGIALPSPWFRATFPTARVWVKQLHIAAGVLSILVLLAYVPFIGKHVRQLAKKKLHRFNLGFVLLLLGGWALSGAVLWQFRRFPGAWTNVALTVHDVFSWVGIPYAVYHSLTRLRWVKKLGYRPLVLRGGEGSASFGEGASAAAADMSELESGPASADAGMSDSSPAAAAGSASGPRREAAPDAVSTRMAGYRPLFRADEPRDNAPPPAPADGPRIGPISRRAFLRSAIALALALGVGPSFIRWLKRAFDDGGVPAAANVTDANALTPPPVPAAASLPPAGGGANGRFRLYSVTPLPVFTNENFAFTVDGLVEKPLQWTWEQFVKLPRKVQVSDFHCVTGWTVDHCTWEGIPLADLLKRAGVKPAAKQVKFYSGDGVYTDSLTLQQAHVDDVMVALLFDGKPIDRDHGGPARLIVPKMYGYKSVKWLVRMELIASDHTGYWEERGYSKDAWYDPNRPSDGFNWG